MKFRRNSSQCSGRPEPMGFLNPKLRALVEGSQIVIVERQSKPAARAAKARPSAPAIKPAAETRLKMSFGSPAWCARMDEIERQRRSNQAAGSAREHRETEERRRREASDSWRRTFDRLGWA